MPQFEWTFCRAEAGDAPAIATLFLAARTAAMPWLVSPHSDDDTHRWVAEVLVPSSTLQIARLGEAPIAMLVVANGWIDHLYVAPPWQGRGIGSQAVEVAKAMFPTGLELWTFQRNDAARRFYERHGFLPVEFTDGVGNEEREPDVRYVWSPGSR